MQNSQSCVQSKERALDDVQGRLQEKVNVKWYKVTVDA
jgi:hypothetical protein